ncbi:MAG: prepilin-type N-terminal cleavage/methylation domain-containing protein [Candidatus Gracilibacteria bacterium]|nr:prepilin-type N-terminal cleavage/methylation domain-containing protein [Candidatus Gracilibacteria bacterium]
MPTSNTKNNKTSHTSHTIISPKNFLGFTLIELIVVITILVILGTIAFLNLGGFQRSARDGQRVSDLTNISKGLDIFQIKTGSYPTPVNMISYTGGMNGGTVLVQGTLNGNLIGFSSATPGDPLTNTGYVYSILGNGQYYQIGAEAENTVALSLSPSGGVLGSELGSRRGGILRQIFLPCLRGGGHHPCI